MPLTKEDLKEAARKWNWRPSMDAKEKVTPNVSAKREGIARRKREALQDDMRLAREFAL